jgi:hypothetical protein
MVVFTGSEVDHTPTKSGIKGQLPCTADESENCTSFPDPVALWSAIALGGVIPVVIMHVSLEVPPQALIDVHQSMGGSSQYPLRILKNLRSMHVKPTRLRGPVHERPAQSLLI